MIRITFLLFLLYNCFSFKINAQINIPTIQTNSWMGDIYEGIKDVKLKEMKLLGTHNALYERDGGANFCDQQGESIASQFLDGARYFDTRIGYDGSFYAFHGSLCSYVYGADTDLQDLKTALDNNPQEVIILEIHQTEGDNQAIADMLYSIFGNILIENTNSIQLTYEEAINEGQVLLIFNTNPSSNANAFWSSSFITSDWLGTNDNDELRDWVATQINTLDLSDYPSDQFWVRQCARSYVAPFTFESLMSMSEGTNRRFEEAWIDENLWMSKDWNCIKLDWFGYHNHLQKVVERIARWYYSTNAMTTSVDLPKGVYKIRAKHSNKVLTPDGVNITQYVDLNLSAQQWIVEPVGKGRYLISGLDSGEIIEVTGDQMANTSNVLQKPMRPFNNAYWLLEEAEMGYYYVRSLSSGRGLDVEGISTNDGANVSIYDIVGADNQKFAFELINPLVDSNFKMDKEYILEAKHSSKLIELANGASSNGSLLVQNECNGTKQQRWRLHYFGANQYIVEVLHSNKVLDGTNSGSNLYQWKRNDSTPQHFVLMDLGNGYYSIKSQYTQQFASVSNASLDNGAQIIFEPWTNADHQQWSIVDVTNSTCISCPDDLALSNPYQSDTYQAINSITATGNIIDNVLFSAGTSVDLLPGFCANPQNGACFEVQMAACIE